MRVPRELLVLYYLAGRRVLSDEECLQYERLRRGFSGELIFREAVREVFGGSDGALFSVTLPYGGSVFQLDQLIVCGEAIFFHEVKHFAGDFVVDGERWFLLRVDGGRQEINSPFVQMERAGSYLRRLVADLGYERRVIGRAVFTHEAFALFGAQYGGRLFCLGRCGVICIACGIGSCGLVGLMMGSGFGWMVRVRR